MGVHVHYPEEITYYKCVKCLFTFSGEELDAQEFDGVDTNKDSFYDEENLYKEENRNNNNIPKNTRPYPIGDSVPEPMNPRKPNYPNNRKNQEDPKLPKYPDNPENSKYPDYPDYPETPVESELAQDSQAGM